MSAGTIALTNKSAAVTGTGTAFTTDLAPNDFIVFTVGQTTYTLAVKTILSDTSLTLVRVFDGPASSDTAWTALPASALVQITSEIVAQTTDALRAQNYDRYNWERVYSESNNITVTLSDGSTFTGPSWKKISDLLADIDVDTITEIAAQIRADAAQVDVDTQTASAAASTATAAAADAQTSASNASTANAAAQQAKTDAATSATTATTEADRAKTEADRAAASNPANALIKTSNLSDLTDKPQARTNLDVYSKTEADARGAGWIGKVDICPLRSAVPGGRVAGDGQIADRAGIYAGVWAECEAGRLPLVDDAVWLADPSKRGCYSRGNGSTTFRLPDYNGVQSGSYPAPVWRGDGGLTDGNTQQNAAPEISGDYTVFGAGAGVMNSSGAATGAFSRSNDSTAVSSPEGRTAAGYGLLFRASGSSLVYGRNGASEVRMNAIVGCWVIQYAGVANNAGSIDALALANRIEQVNTAISNRIGYALITTPTNLSLGARTVLANPFGSSVPVMTICEIYNATLGKWTTTPWVHIGSGVGQNYGVTSAYSENEGIVLRAGNSAFVASSQASGASQDTADYTTPSPIRVHVFKVTQ